MPFLQLTFEVTGGDAEALEATCFAAGALAVTLTDAADTPIFEPELDTTPLWPKVRVRVLFAAEAEREPILANLAAALGAAPRGTKIEEVADRAWEREWLVDFKPMRFGERLWVCPHRQSVDARDATVVRLDPGLAFGTGTHPTTALCLEWLDGAPLAGCTLIDYGCGSGILAIAGIKLGARRARAVDHDPQALIATRDNAARNGVERAVEALSPQELLPEAQVLVANILALPLIGLAERFATLVVPGGHLVLSGILTAQADAVAAAYVPWFAMDAPAVRDDWVRLHGRRR